MTPRILTSLVLAAALLAPVPATVPAAAEPTMAGTTFTWQTVPRARAFGDSLFVERTHGATATLRFNGSTVVWYTWRGPGHGRARIYLDGALLRTVNNHAEGAVAKAKRIVRTSPGRHVLKIFVLGERGAPGGGRAVAVDAFRVDGAFVRADAAIYRWAHREANDAAGNAFRRSRVRDATASFTFTGKGIDWVTMTGPDQGKARILVDGRARRTVDNYAPTRTFGVLRSLAGLTDEQHTVTIEVLGERHDDARGTSVALDGWIVRRPRVRAFRGFGAWVDLFDYDRLDPAATTADLAARGVRTLYLQTARYNSGRAFLYRAEAGEWLEQAHARGIKVVGWYLPAYSEFLDRDVRRTVAIADFRSPAGHRFDALAVDIEFKGKTSSLEEFNDGIRAHLRRVRLRIGNRAPMGAITPSPVAMARYPSSWTGFPWAAIGRYADVVLPMAYWSYRTADGSCDEHPLYCPLRYTEENIRRSRTKTGLPVHVIGGVGDGIGSRSEIEDFVAGARAGNPMGGSLYDYRTTKASWWSTLAELDDV